MSEPKPRRSLGGHLRRHGIAYTALVVAFSFSPLPSMAADLVTTSEIANGAVTTPKLAGNSVVSGKILDKTVSSADIKNGTISDADLSTSARGAKVIRYKLGANDFSTNQFFELQLPGTWNAAKVGASEWTGSLHYDGGLSYTVPGPGVNGGSSYRLYVWDDGRAGITLTTGPGEAYDEIRLYRTVSTSTRSVASSAKVRSTGPERERADR